MTDTIENRKSLIVYVYSTKQVRQLKKYGLIYYVSQKMHYVVMYVNADNYDWIKEKISSLKIVKKLKKRLTKNFRVNYHLKVTSKMLMMMKIIKEFG
ncbi:hypothetical protein AKUG0410_09370 [Apilactobacillus kunkeei]|nr:hypothetical protein AKUG0412_09370 [Apilactobacillus kunkeei]CAI2682640.1 hypothetical protein AKUG0410_09370 [Apilactobacillus kunkeei]